MTNVPWAFVAHKGNCWGGSVAATAPPDELGRFLVEFATAGYAITTVHSRDEYRTLCNQLDGAHEWSEP